MLIIKIETYYRENVACLTLKITSEPRSFPVTDQPPSGSGVISPSRETSDQHREPTQKSRSNPNPVYIPIYKMRESVKNLMNCLYLLPDSSSNSPELLRAYDLVHRRQAVLHPFLSTDDNNFVINPTLTELPKKKKKKSQT